MPNTNKYENILLSIPTLNEEKSISNVIINSLNHFDKNDILIIDGNSTDDTLEIAKSYDIKFIIQKSNGKGSAMIETIEYAIENNYDTVVFIDGDMTYDVNEIGILVNHMNSQKIDMVIGNRLNKKRGKGSITPFNIIGNFLFSILMCILFFMPLIDTQSGFRAIKIEPLKTILPQLTSVSFEIETELTCLFKRYSYSIGSVPITYSKRPDGSFTKLNPIKVGFRILKKIIEVRFKSIR